MNRITLLFCFAILINTFVFGQSLSGKIIIDGMYATNTASPVNNYSIFKCFDQDQSTYWATPKGAGPDEGIMIYFDKPTYIHSIKIDFNKGNGFIEKTAYQVYSNGMNLGSGRYIDAEIESIYIRLFAYRDISSKKETIGTKTYVQNIFNPELAIAISEISFLGKKDNKLEVVIPKQEKGTIKASSTLSPKMAYSPQLMNDCSRDFAWAEGNPGNGKDEIIEFVFDKEVSVDRLKIWNGYQRSAKHFKDNTRAKAFSFGLAGVDIIAYNLLDKQMAQNITLSKKITGKHFILKINDIYPGVKYKDLVISEIRLFDGDTPILLQTGFDKTKVDYVAKTGNNILKSVLNRNISTRISKENPSEKGVYENSNISLIIRSNQSFVFYKDYYYEEETEEGYYEDQKTTIADGGWEIVEQTDSKVKLRIFGKIYNTTTDAELYKGDAEFRSVRVFQDFVTITKSSIKSQKTFEEIKLLW